METELWHNIAKPTKNDTICWIYKYKTNREKTTKQATYWKE